MNNKKSERDYGRKPTKMFLGYVARLIFRTCVFLFMIYTFITNPQKLYFSTYFGPAYGFNLVDFVFICLVMDIATKFLPSAPISMGALKQYREFHVPTVPMFEGGRDGLIKFAKDMFTQGKLTLESLPDAARKLAVDSLSGSVDGAKRILRSIDVLRVLPYSEEMRSSTEEVRISILRRRSGEILPALVFWVVFNIAVGMSLAYFGWFSEATVLLWVQFYAMWDMVCVVLWCPIQLIFMKNRCCTTCQIFNWDAIMTSTPLLTVMCPFSWLLLGLSLLVLIRWELAVARHPERFDERTNLSLQCANCKDRLCYLRTPLEVHIPRDVKIEPSSHDDVPGDTYRGKVQSYGTTVHQGQPRE